MEDSKGMLRPHGLGVFPEGRGLELLAALATHTAHTMPLRKDMRDHQDDLMHCAAGTAGEAGELLDAIKKNWAYNKPLDIDNIREEAGDLLFYLLSLLDLLDIPLYQVIEANTAKLAKRYPAGYSDKAAQERADKQGVVQEDNTGGNNPPETP